MSSMEEARYRAMTEANATAIFTVYNSPKDMPGFFVVRMHIANKDGSRPTDYAWTFLDLWDARSALEREGLIPIERDPNDDPVIVECWV